MADEPAAEVMDQSPEPAAPAEPAEPREAAPQAAAPSSSPEQQAGEPQAEQPRGERKTLKQMLAEDPDLNAEYQRELDRTIKKRLERQQRRQLKQEIEAVVRDEDYDRALEQLKKVSSVLDQDDDGEDDSPQQRAWRNTQLLHDHSDKGLGWLTGEREYAYLWERHQDELNAKLAELSPRQFAEWVLEQGREREIERLAEQRANQKAKVLAEAMATEQTAKALQNVPVPPSGNGTGTLSDERKIELYANGEMQLDLAELRRLKLLPR